MSQLSEPKVVTEMSATTAGVLTPDRSERTETVSGWARFILGDWGRIVRDPLDVLRIAFFAGTIVWVAIGGAAADGLVGASLVLLGGRLLNLPRPYDLALIIGMTLTGWGSALHFYGQYEWYDDVVHCLMPLLMTPIVYILLVRLQVLPKLGELKQLHRQAGFFLIAFCIGMTIAGGWEVIEWWLDQWTGDTRVKDAADTASDLTMGVFGSIGAAFTLIAWNLLDLPLFRESPEGAVRWIREHRLAGQLRRQQPEAGIA
jgi:hypothetical protein